MTVILFDKFKNRVEKITEMTTAQEEILIMQDIKGESHQIKYILQFYDKKSRPVYIEKQRTLIESSILDSK